MKIYCKGGVPQPPPPPPPPPPDPAANEQAKSAAAEAKSRERRRAQAGTINGTLATRPEGVFGTAPSAAPELKSTLG